MSKKVNIGVVGLGYMGKKHIECYSKISNANMVAAADVNADSFKNDTGCEFRLYKTIDEMIREEELDAVDICLPTILHKEAVIKALNHGLNVLVEKPFALQPQEADEMIECSIRNDKSLMVAHVCRFLYEYRFAKEIIEVNSLGNPLFYYACRNSATPKWSVNNWLADKKFSGGTVMDLQIHDIDIANWLLGEPVGYKMVEVNNPSIGTSNFGHIISTIKYKSGCMAVLEAGHLMPGTYPFYTAYRLVCEKGVVEFSKGVSASFTLCRENERIDMTEEYNDRYGSLDPYMDELTHFIDCIGNGRELVITPEEAKNAVVTVNKLMENIF